MPITAGGGTQVIPDNSTVDSAAIQAINTTPALEELRNAYSKGLINAKQMQDLFEGAVQTPGKIQVANENIQASRARQSLIPAQTDLAANKIAAENSLIQPKAKQELGDINNAIALQPSQLESNLGDLAIKNSTFPERQATAQNAAKAGAAEASFQSNEIQKDPTGTNTAARQMYTQLFPGQKMPTTPTGEIDYEEMGHRMAPFLQMRVMYSTEAGKAALKAVDEKKRWDLLYDPKTGAPRPVDQVLKDAAAAPMAPSSEQQVEAAKQLPAANVALANIRDAKLLLKDPDTKVGSDLLHGGAEGMLYKAGSLVGIGTKTYQNQQKLEANLATGIQSQIRNLAGTGNRVMKAELDVFKETQPKLSWDKAAWEDWLNKSEFLIHSSIALNSARTPAEWSKAVTNYESQASGFNWNGGSTALHDEPPAGPIPAPGEKPVTLDKAGTNESNIPRILSQADYDSLKPGMQYLDSAGTLATKR